MGAELSGGQGKPSKSRWISFILYVATQFGHVSTKFAPENAKERVCKFL